jgi:septum formation protein
MSREPRKRVSKIEKPIILASASPRRRELLARAGIPFVAKRSRIPERALPGETPQDQALRLAREKALDVARKHRGRWVLGADTVVELDGLALGTPRDEEEARRMLRLLSGRAHRVITAFAVVDDRGRVRALDAAVSVVRFKKLSEATIASYVRSGEPSDKAGAYAVQGLGASLVEDVEGSYSNVVGLPVERVVQRLEELGVLG